jgi:uroporphyrinogen decarboxylase
MTAEEYNTWGRPFDLRILEAVREAQFNVLHIHGTRIHFNSVMDYPVQALNWSHFATAPSLLSGKELSGKTVLGGIDEVTASHVSAHEIGEQVNAAIREIGTRGLIVTPGCSVPTDTREQSLRQVKTAVERFRK